MTDIEWVEESDWGKVERGQRVKLANDDGSLQLVVNDVSRPIMSYGRIAGVVGIYYSANDWTLYVEAKPAVELPSEAGFYIGRDSLNSNAMFIVRVNNNGKFRYPDNSSHGGWANLADPERFAPFTHPEPVAETAKKVLEALVAEFNKVPKKFTEKQLRDAWGAVIRKFGVTE